MGDEAQRHPKRQKAKSRRSSGSRPASLAAAGAISIADPLRQLQGLSGETLRQKVEEAATLCGLPLELLARFPHQLSGGQRARVGIARAIGLHPDLLVLDEPTAALDVSVQVTILQLLVSLRESLGISYVFVSHDLNVLRLLCDRVVVMYLGRIVEVGSARAVFDAPLHPYTRGLVAAVPRLDGVRADALRLVGAPKSPIDPDPNACRFHGRCLIGTDRCGGLTAAGKPPAIMPRPSPPDP